MIDNNALTAALFEQTQGYPFVTPLDLPNYRCPSACTASLAIGDFQPFTIYGDKRFGFIKTTLSFYVINPDLKLWTGYILGNIILNAISAPHKPYKGMLQITGQNLVRLAQAVMVFSEVCRTRQWVITEFVYSMFLFSMVKRPTKHFIGVDQRGENLELHDFIFSNYTPLLDHFGLKYDEI